MRMMNKRVKRTRIGLAFAGIAAGLLAVITPNAQASPNHHQPTPPHATAHHQPTSPEAAMRAAVRRCLPAPRDVKRACWSLYLRPAIDDIPSGRAVLAECLDQAREEARERGNEDTYARYLRGCILGNIRTP
jgi:hypothetical protein